MRAPLVPKMRHASWIAWLALTSLGGGGKTRLELPVDDSTQAILIVSEIDTSKYEFHGIDAKRYRSGEQVEIEVSIGSRVFALLYQ